MYLWALSSSRWRYSTSRHFARETTRNSSSFCRSFSFSARYRSALAWLASSSPTAWENIPREKGRPSVNTP